MCIKNEDGRLPVLVSPIDCQKNINESRFCKKGWKILALLFENGWKAMEKLLDKQ